MKHFPRVVLSTLLLGMLATPLIFEGVAAASSVNTPTQTTNPVAAGGQTTYSTISVNGVSFPKYVALVPSGLPAGATASDSGDGCVAAPFPSGTVSFSHFTVTAGSASGSFTITATQYSDSSCSKNATTLATSSPTLTVRPPLAASNPTQTTNPVAAGSQTTYSTVTVSNGTNGDFVALAGSGLPTGATASDTGDGCVAVSSSTATFSHFAVTAGSAGGSFTINANEYASSSCTGTVVATAAASATLSVIGPATQLAFVTQPTTGQNIQATGSGTFSASVGVEDANGNLESGTNSGTITLGTNSSSGTLTCTGGLTATVASGIGSFTGCAITKAGAYKLTASSSPSYISPTNATSFNITAGSATTVALSQGYIESTTVGGPFALPMIARVSDTNGNPVAGATVTFTAPSSGASGTFKATAGTCVGTGTSTTSCSATTSSSGQASALTFTANATAGSYDVVVSSPGTTPLNNPMTNLVGAPASLAFIAQPTIGQNIQATGTGSFGATVAVEDAGGNIEANTNSGTVTLGIGTNPSSGVLSCSGGLTSNVVAGEATFTGCSITSAGVGYSLSASSAPSYTAPTNANAFNVIAGSASQLAFVAQPSSSFVGIAMAPFVTVQVEDQNGNATTSSATVTLSPSGSSLSSGASTAAVGGVAAFSGVTFSASGLGLLLTATSPGLASATSSTFDVSVLVTKSADQLTDTATDSGGSGMKSVTYYYCAGFSNATACGANNGTEIGSPSTSSPFSVAWSPLPSSGAYRVVAIGSDSAGNTTTSGSTPVSVDASGPVGGAVSVPNYATSLSVTITSSSFTDSLVGMTSNVITRSSGLSPAGGICPSSGYAGSTVVTSPDTGVVTGKCYDYTLTGTSSANQVATVTSGPVLVDTTPPVTTITLNPASPNGTNGWYGGADPTFTLATSDGGAGVQATYYEIDGGPATVYPGSAVTIPDGAAQTVSYWSVDNAGNVESAHTTATLSIDAASPTGSITSPAPNASVSGTVAVSSTNVADSLSGVASVTFQYATHGGSSWITIATDNASPYTENWSTASLAGGQYDLRMVTTDNAGNSATSTTVTVTVASSYTGGTGTNDMVNGTDYYRIDTTSTGSGSSTANTITPGVAETLTGLTFKLDSSSGSTHSATVGYVAAGVWHATALTCTITGGSGNTQCTSTGSVSIPVGDSINVRGLGNGAHEGTWITTYTRP